MESNPYDEYAEVEDPYQTLERKEGNGYAMLDMDNDAAPGKK